MNCYFLYNNSFFVSFLFSTLNYFFSLVYIIYFYQQFLSFLFLDNLVYKMLRNTLSKKK